MKKIILIMALISVISCSEKVEQKEIESVVTVPSFKIDPPVADVNEKSTHFSIDNSEDTILISENGGYLAVPKDCFVDEDGKSITTDVNIEFTEYLNPADILLSGIPMTFMDGEDTMNFQSAGMCKVLASTESKSLQLKPDKEIEIGLRNMAQDENYNLYFFDTLNGNWAEKQKDIVPLATKELPIKPVNLQSIDTDKLITINIDRYQMRPLYKMWHKSKFQIYGEQQISKPDSSIWWYDMSVLPSENPDIFELTFTGVDGNTNQCSQKMLVQPTIDSVNFEFEISLFYQNMRTYIKELRQVEDVLKQSKIDETKIDAMWEEQKEIDSIFYANELIQDSINLVRELEYHKIAQTRVEVMRSFSITQMGIFNCDRFYTKHILARQHVGFKVSGVKTYFDNSFLVSKYDNAVLKYLNYNSDRYTIDFANDMYSFVGILGGDIYHAYIYLNATNSNYQDIEISKVSKDELNQIMS